MARAILFLLPVICAMPAAAATADERENRPERRSCVDLPPMAKGKKCRELPSMATPDAPGENARRNHAMKMRLIEPQQQRAIWTQSQANIPR